MSKKMKYDTATHREAKKCALTPSLPIHPVHVSLRVVIATSKRRFMFSFPIKIRGT